MSNQSRRLVSPFDTIHLDSAATRFREGLLRPAQMSRTIDRLVYHMTDATLFAPCLATIRANTFANVGCVIVKGVCRLLLQGRRLHLSNNRRVMDLPTSHFFRGQLSGCAVTLDSPFMRSGELGELGDCQPFFLIRHVVPCIAFCYAV